MGASLVIISSHIVIICCQVGASTLQRLSQHRRDLLKPHVKDRYEQLCNRPDKEGLELLGGSDLDEKISNISKITRISKRDFLGQRQRQRGGRDHASSSRSYSGRSNLHSVNSRYNNNWHRADGFSAHRQRGKMRHAATRDSLRKGPYPKKGSNKRWKKN